MVDKKEYNQSNEDYEQNNLNDEFESENNIEEYEKKETNTNKEYSKNDHSKNQKKAHSKGHKHKDLKDSDSSSDKIKNQEEVIRFSKVGVLSVISVILLILLLLSLFTNVFGNQGSGGKKLSDDEVKRRVISTIDAIQPGLNPEILNIKRLPDGTYEFTIIIQGQPLKSYLSSDGSMLYPQGLPVPITNTLNNLNNMGPANPRIEKTAKPEVELYVWSYCPYGVQAQGPLAEVVKVLGNTANFKIVQFHDGHGLYERQQNKIQLCIQKIEPNKYWNYASEFVKSIYPKCNSNGDVNCDLSESIKVMDSLGINYEAVLDCVENEGDKLFSESRLKAQTNGVSGSPTLIINGVPVQVSRTAEAFKAAVCSAYINPPSECDDVKLDNTAPPPVGNC